MFRVYALGLASVFLMSGQAVLTSPDGNLSLTIKTAGDHRLVYAIGYKRKPLVEDSNLQLTLQGARPLGSNVIITAQTPSQGEDNYTLVTGKTSHVQDRFDALSVTAEENTGTHRQLIVEARAFNDGVAFRYVIPEQPRLHDYRLVSEDTQFKISKDATTYALVLPHFHTMYESEFLKLPISAFGSTNGLSRTNLIGLPLAMDVPGVAWMAITEADMRGNAAIYLTDPNMGWSGKEFVSKIAPGDDPEVAVRGTLPHHSAWRVFLIGDEPGRLIESNIITSLNPESEIKDTSWIHAGLTAWDWWSGDIDKEGKPAFTTENMKYYVDFAAKSKFPYMLIDAGWSVPGDITRMNGKVDVPEVVRYAAAKNVKVWIWLTYTETDKQMDEAFPLYAKWGVAGMKIDFVERDDQKGIDFYYRAAELAARNHLMVDFHGATKPTGIDRTFPNVMGYEAVLGMEQSKGGMRDNPDHRVMLPFTRMLAGRMDYTPGGFDNVTKDAFVPQADHPMVMGTRAQQLAMYAIYEAPFQMVSDTPKNYEDQPAFGFIEHVPATWDETKVLGGSPGEFITMARRNGNGWWLGSITNWSARELDIPLSFLGPGKWTAEIYADADDAAQYPKGVSIRKETVDSNMHLKAKLAPGGGYAVQFTRASR